MTRLEGRNRLYVVIVAVAASVFLFACGGERRDAPESAAGPPSAPGGPPVGPPASGRGSDTQQRAQSAWPEPAGEASSPGERSAVNPGRSFGTAETGTGESPARSIPTSGASGERVFSNKDLERYRRLKDEFGLRDDVLATDGTKQPSSAAAEKPTGMTAAQRAAEIETTREKISSLTQELDYQKNRVLPLLNPFLPVPRVSDDDKLAEAGLNNAERLRRVKERIAEIESELSALQSRLTELDSMKPTEEPGGDEGTPPRDQE